MKKHTYTATAPDGSTHTRTTDRTYTHAVMVRRDSSDRWGCPAFSGRHDLAVKEAARFAKHVGAANVAVVPATLPE